MEKDNKYYNLIEKLVKEHRKFPGYEAILEDIIDDVYAHSEIVINTIQNDSVIESYLQKVVSTSIISVPKKLNIKNNNYSNIRRIDNNADSLISHISEQKNNSFVQTDEHDSSENILHETEEVFQQNVQPELNTLEESIETSKSNDVTRANAEYVDNMINSIASDSVITKENDDTEELLLELENESLEDVLIDEDDDFEITSSDDLSEQNSGDTVVLETGSTELSVSEDSASEIDIDEETLVQEDETPVQSLELQEIDADEEALVQEDETPVQSFELQEIDADEEALVQEDETPVQSLELQEINADEEALVQEDETPVQSLELQEINADEEALVQEDETPVQSLELQEIDADDETLVQEDETPAQSLELQEANIDEENETHDEIIDIESDSSLNEDFNTDEISDNFDITNQEFDEFNITEDQSESLDLSFETNDIDLNEHFDKDNGLLLEDDRDDDTKQESESLPFKRIDYSVFELEQVNPSEKIKYNADIPEKIQDLNNLYPELSILDVFNLKYKENLSVEDIALKLNTDKKDVLSALNKLVDIV